MPPQSSLQLPLGQSAEWKSAELGQPFAGNPFATDPLGNAHAGLNLSQKTHFLCCPTELSVLSAPLLTQLQVEAELAKAVTSTKKPAKEYYELFGPPTNQKQQEQAGK